MLQWLSVNAMLQDSSVSTLAITLFFKDYSDYIIEN